MVRVVVFPVSVIRFSTICPDKGTVRTQAAQSDPIWQHECGWGHQAITCDSVHLSSVGPCAIHSRQWHWNKANQRDSKAANDLMILYKLDSNHQFVSPCDLEICSSILCQALCILSNPLVNSNWSYRIDKLNAGQNWRIFGPMWPLNLMDDFKQR